MCWAFAGVHWKEHGPTEHWISVYDDGDEEVPAFLLVNGQIDELIAKAEGTPV